MSDQNIVKSLIDIRKDFERALAIKDTFLARALLAELWSSYPGPASAPVLLSGYKAIEGFEDNPESRPLNVCILRSFTVEPSVPLLEAAALVNSIKLNVTLGGFNAYAQEILSSKSLVYKSEIDVAFIVTQTRDIAPDIWSGECELLSERVEEIIKRFESLINAFRSNSNAYLILHNLEQPAWTSQGNLDIGSQFSQRDAINRINIGLVEVAEKNEGVHILDYDSLVSRHGRASWSDESRWLTMRMPLGIDNLCHLVDEWLKFIVPVSGRIAKAVVVDLDNTLWGGVLGEEGIKGIHLDCDYPGGAFQEVQRALLDLYNRGILLAVCSKNDETEALAVIEKHPGMVLKKKNFAAFKINWLDKATNIKAIARELNIGCDSIAFLDDNAAERLWVRKSLPDVSVIDLKDDPSTYARSLRHSPVFERLTLSNEDKQRGRIYSDQKQRDDLLDNTASLEDFYWSLDMKLDVFLATSDDVARVAQLTQKTNQFNLTTRRYSESEIDELINNPSFEVFAARVADRFGDNGIISVVIVETIETTARLDTFLMSCRVIGKTVETGILSIVADRLGSKGAKILIGQFIASGKNFPAKEFFADHGFKKNKNLDWSIKLPSTFLNVPEWFKI